jgi:hypothetical protein
MGEVQRADIAEQRSIESMQFSLADAQRKERMGDIRGAQAAMETARKAKADANRFNLNKAVALGTLDAKALQSLRPAGKAAGSGEPKEQPLDRVTAAMNDKLIEMRAKDPNDPQIPVLEAKIKGRKEIIGMGKEGPTAAPRAAAALTAKQNESVAKSMAVWEGGGEYNVARGLRKCFGLRTAIVTKLADNDVGRKLTPRSGDLRVLHLEDGRAVGVRDAAGPLGPFHGVVNVLAGLGEASRDLHCLLLPARSIELSGESFVMTDDVLYLVGSVRRRVHAPDRGFE